MKKILAAIALAVPTIASAVVYDFTGSTYKFESGQYVPTFAQGTIEVSDEPILTEVFSNTIPVQEGIRSEYALRSIRFSYGGEVFSSTNGKVFVYNTTEAEVGAQVPVGASMTIFAINQNGPGSTFIAMSRGSYADEISTALPASGSFYERSNFTINGGPGGSIDSLEVSPVPEPETWAMFFAGLLAIGFVRNRRS